MLRVMDQDGEDEGRRIKGERLRWRGGRVERVRSR